MRRETDLKFDENGKAILGVTKVIEGLVLG
jgi:hypothetical protein